MEKEIPNLEEKMQESLAEARNVLKIEAESVLDLRDSINGEFADSMRLILSAEGRVIFIGVGKSGLIAKKLAATFSSTGTPAFFVHAGEALHGDLGMITGDDVVIAVSNSGETDEILGMLPSIRRIGAAMISLTGGKNSTLADYSDICLNFGVEEEACPIGLAPTASTTACLALGDALGIALSTLKGFTSEDYAIFHPGGSLGRKLLTTVKDVLEVRGQNPTVTADTTVKRALFVMTDTRMGSTSVVNQDGEIIGIIADGDIRRLLEESTDFLSRSVKECMTEEPTIIEPDRLATEALQIMEEKEINDLPVVKMKKPVGMLNFQDLLRARVF
ncbi:MAG: KpsF/GutQ family sugar-phosphate isomerase [Halanaerobiaceae bacterium]